jgi:hypothetical protein
MTSGSLLVFPLSCFLPVLSGLGAGLPVSLRGDLESRLATTRLTLKVWVTTKVASDHSRDKIVKNPVSGKQVWSACGYFFQGWYSSLTSPVASWLSLDVDGIARYLNTHIGKRPSIVPKARSRPKMRRNTWWGGCLVLCLFSNLPPEPVLSPLGPTRCHDHPQAAGKARASMTRTSPLQAPSRRRL